MSLLLGPLLLRLGLLCLEGLLLCLLRTRPCLRGLLRPCLLRLLRLSLLRPWGLGLLLRSHLLRLCRRIRLCGAVRLLRVRGGHGCPLSGVRLRDRRRPVSRVGPSGKTRAAVRGSSCVQGR